MSYLNIKKSNLELEVKTKHVDYGRIAHVERTMTKGRKSQEQADKNPSEL